MANSSRIFYGSPDGFSLDRCDILPTYCGDYAYLADVTRNGHLDILVGDKRGYVLIYLGGPEGYSPDRTRKIPMWTDWAGAVSAAADLNGNGWLDLVVSSQGHYLRRPDTFTIFYGGPGGYGWDHAQDYKGGFSPGRISVCRLEQQRASRPDRASLFDGRDARLSRPYFLERRRELRPGASAQAARGRRVRRAAGRSEPQRLHRPDAVLSSQRRRPRGGLADLLERPGGALERPHDAASRYGAALPERPSSGQRLHARAH